MGNADPMARQSWSIITNAVLAALLGAAGTIAADVMLSHPDASPRLRLAAVLLAVLALVPWLVTIAGSVFRSRSEDFIHHVMVFAAVISFVGAVAFAVLAIALERAGFVQSIPLSMVWPALAGVWGASVFIGQRHYQ